MKKLLWLDDVRNPYKKNHFHLYNSPISLPFCVIWVKNYNEFIKWIELNGLPDGICFDHDLGDEHYNKDMFVSEEAYNRHYENFKEKTGYDAAKWLIDYCINNNKKLPPFNVHSFNPVGSKNIKTLLNNFNKNIKK